VVHVSGRVDPLADIETIITELALADLAVVERTLNREGKKAKSGDKDAQKLVAILERLLPHLNEGHPARTLALSDDEKLTLKPLCLLTIKPAMYVGNVREDGFENNRTSTVCARTGGRKARRLWRCAQIEAELADWMMKTEPRSGGLGRGTGLNRLIRVGYKLLGCRLTLRPASRYALDDPCRRYRPQCGVIHRLQRGYIRAQTLPLPTSSPIRASKGKEAGKMRSKQGIRGQDGDVLNPVQRLSDTTFRKGSANKAAGLFFASFAALAISACLATISTTVICSIRLSVRMRARTGFRPQDDFSRKTIGVGIERMLK
jgi:hypothetical protein